MKSQRRFLTELLQRLSNFSRDKTEVFYLLRRYIRKWIVEVKDALTKSTKSLQGSEPTGSLGYHRGTKTKDSEPG